MGFYTLLAGGSQPAFIKEETVSARTEPAYESDTRANPLMITRFFIP
jgi:hypothetical protein